MRSKKFSTGLTLALAIIARMALMTTPVAAQTEQVVHYFTDSGVDGYRPTAGLAMDGFGNLYGTTYWGGLGATSNGTVFELIPNSSGGWSEKILHTFYGQDGVGPMGGVVLDAKGNIYGTTFVGGEDAGTVFELTPAADGTWTEKTLYTFNGSNGYSPTATMIFDAAGNLYGTTFGGGMGNGGIAFQLTPNSDGSWTENILYKFCSQLKCLDGFWPAGGLVFDGHGNLFGTASGGGAYEAGVVFELSQSADGAWVEKVLHSFKNDTTDGWSPESSLIFDAAGNLYGTTLGGGTGTCYDGCGTVFELSPSAAGVWREKILHDFATYGDGHDPYSALVLDGAGNLYGTTEQGGKTMDGGTVFELSPATGGSWKETILYNFPGDIFTVGPAAGLVFDGSGNLYGTSEGGGECRNLTNGGCGFVFEITP